MTHGKNESDEPARISLACLLWAEVKSASHSPKLEPREALASSSEVYKTPASRSMLAWQIFNWLCPVLPTR
jgi:hypothetical protein